MYILFHTVLAAYGSRVKLIHLADVTWDCRLHLNTHPLGRPQVIMTAANSNWHPPSGGVSAALSRAGEKTSRSLAHSPALLPSWGWAGEHYTMWDTDGSEIRELT